MHISSKQPEAKRNAGPVGTGKETAQKKEIGIPGAYPRSTRCVNLGMLTPTRFQGGVNVSHD